MYTWVMDGYVCNGFHYGFQEFVNFAYSQGQAIMESDDRIICARLK